MSEKIIIFWFRKDLRIQDNIALEEAGKEAKVFPIYINDDKTSLHKRIQVIEHKILPIGISIAGLRWRKMNRQG